MQKHLSRRKKDDKNFYHEERKEHEGVFIIFFVSLVHLVVDPFTGVRKYIWIEVEGK